jgi:hypothetical protein
MDPFGDLVCTLFDNPIVSGSPTDPPGMGRKYVYEPR